MGNEAETACPLTTALEVDEETVAAAAPVMTTAKAKMRTTSFIVGYL